MVRMTVVCCQIAGRSDRGLSENDRQWVAKTRVGYATRVIHTQDIVAERGPSWIVAGPGRFARVHG